MADLTDPQTPDKLTEAQGGETDSKTQSTTAPPTNQPSADSSALHPNAPSQDNSNRIQVKVPPRDETLVNSNVLDNYINVIYNISLGMVSKTGKEAIQQSNVQKADIGNNYTVFASTGDTKTSPDYEGNYCNIQSLVFTSFVGHLPQNPMTAAIWDGKMGIFEPYGFNWRENMIDLAEKLDYDATSMLDFVYRLEIWFSGYDPVTGEWTKQIDLNVYNGKTIQSVVYYLVITTAEAKVTPTGTFYQLSFQTFSHNATRAESLVVHQTNISTGGIDLSSADTPTFGKFLEELGKRLHDQIDKDTQGQINITYKFHGLKSLFDAPFINDVHVNFSSGVTFNTNSGSYAVAANSVDIFTLTNQVMGSLQLVRDSLVRDDNPEFTEPGVLWNIRTNISQASDLNKDISCYQNYTFEYIFEPVLTFRSRTTEYDQRKTQVDYANQLKRVNAMAAYGMIIRKYDYMFTNNNSEIIEFDLMFKNFYYVPFPYPGEEVVHRGLYAMSPDASAKKEQAEAKAKAARISTAADVKPLLFTATGNTATADALGIPTPPVSNSNERKPGPTFGYMHRGPAHPPSPNLGMAELKQQKYSTAKDQYLRYDMMNAQMTIRFDPVWLMNPYMAGADYTPTIPEASRSSSDFAYAHTDKVIFINAPRPNQASFMNPDTSVSLTDKTPIMAGFYQVLYVINEFNGGKFVQKLNMIKYDHLNYFGTDQAQPGAPQQFTTQSVQTAPGASQGVTNADPAAGASL